MRKCMSVCVLVLLISASSMMVGSAMADSESADALKKWTIGLYWAVDNDLDPIYNWYPDSMNFTSDYYPDLWESSLTNRAEIGLAVFMDRLEGACTTVLDENGWVTTQSFGPVNSSNPEVLQEFVEYFTTEDSLEAEHYILVIMDHGLGYLGIVRDEGEPLTWMMSIDGLRGALDGAALKTGKRLDIVDLDACCMTTAEVAYELRDVAGYMVASQMTTAMDGLNYMDLLKGLSEHPSMTPIELACKIVDDYEDWYSTPLPYNNQWCSYYSRYLQDYPTIYPYMQDFATLSVINLTKMPELGAAFAAFSNAVPPGDKTLMTSFDRAARDNLIFKWENNMCVGFNADVLGMFGDLAILLRDTHPELSELCEGVAQAADEAIVKNWASWRFQGTPNGMSVFTPPSLGIYNVNWDTTLNRVYDEIGLDFVDDTNWNEVLLEYFCHSYRG